MGQRRRPRQRPCRPPDLHRRGAGPHRADRPESVPRARLVRRRHRGSAAARLRDGRNAAPGRARHRQPRSGHEPGESRRDRRAGPGTAGGFAAGDRFTGRVAACRPRAYVRRAASWRSGSTIWRWIRTRRARCSWRRGSSSPTRTCDELVRRTEGWPVGLYLAALAVNAGGSPTTAGVAFTGDDRFIGDYLRSEFLDRVSPAEASFLTHTSILDRMCGPLCDAVLGVTGSSDAPRAVGEPQPAGGPARPTPGVVPLPPPVPRAARVGAAAT